MSAATAAARAPVAALGEHTAELLAEIGYNVINIPTLDFNLS